MNRFTRRLKLVLSLTTAVVLAGLVLAQTLPQLQPPLSSVSRDAPWTEFGDNYRLAVFAAGANQPLQLELYSPDINLNDYFNRRDPSANFYGDEIYSTRAPVSTTFTLSTPEGQVLAQKTYGTATTHRFDRFFLGTLPQGYYPFKARTTGPGKNGFGFRISQGATIEASQFTVVKRGRFNQDQLVARITINPSAVGKLFRIENYDADGPKEAKLFVLLPGNKRRALSVSGNLQWAGDNLRITPEMVGEWAILVRILPTTKQFSNSIGFRTLLDGKPYFVRMPQAVGEAPQGSVNVNAEAQVCTQKVPLTGVNFTYSNQSSQTPANLVLLPGSYTLNPAALPGATTNPVDVTVQNKTHTTATLSYQVRPSLQIEPAEISLQSGQIANLKIILSSEFPQAVPYKLNLRLPQGITLVQPPVASGTVKAGKPVELTAVIRADQATQGNLTVTLEPDCASASTSINVQAPPPPQPAALTLSKTVKPAQAQPGDSVVYTLTATNTGGTSVQGVKLSDPLPTGLQGQPLERTFDLAAGESKTFSTTAIVAPNAPNKIDNTATLFWSQAPISATASLSVTKPAAPAALTLTRSPLSPSPALPGEETKVCLQVTNQGGTAAAYTLKDDPTALLEPQQPSTFSASLEPGATQTDCYTARTTAGTSDQSTLKATLTSPGQPDQTATTPFERINLGLAKTTDTPSIQVGQPARYAITVTNPLSRVVTAELKGESKLQLTPTETRTMQLEPGDNRFEVTGLPQEAGQYPNTVNVMVNGIQAAPPATAEVVAQAVPPPAAVRESEIVVAARLSEPPSAGTVILSDRIPAGSKYELGSTRLARPAQTPGSLEPTVVSGLTRENTVPLADPLVAGDRLYWVIPGSLEAAYVLSYKVTHADPIELPADRLGVVLQLPQSKSAGKPRTPNGQPVLGSLGDLRLLSGPPEVLDGLPRAVPIATQTSLSDFSLVQGGGPATEILVYPTRPLTTDKADQNELTVVVRDANGNPANVPYVSANITPEPATPDAFPDVPGYQIKIENGQGSVRLSDLGQSGQGLFSPGSPDVVKVVVRSQEVRAEATFPVEATNRPLIVVGSAGVQLNLTNFNTFSLETSLNAFARGNILDNRALLTGAINTGGSFSVANGFLFTDSNLLPPANPFDRFPLTGDGQIQGSDAPSSDCCFLRLERGSDYLQYGQMNPGFGGLLTGYSAGYNGLKGVLSEGGFSFKAFAALTPNANQRVVLPGDRSSVYRLPVPSGLLPVVDNSEQVQVVVRSADNPNIVLSRTTLIRNTDYTIDYPSGVITLRTPLEPTDLNGNPQSLEIAYALGTPNQELRAGAQVGYEAGNFGLKATVLRFDAGQPALLGFGLRYQGGPLSAEAEVAAGLNSLSLAAGAANVLYRTDTFNLSARYQDLPPGYIDPNSAQPANPQRDLALNLGWKATDRFSLAGAYTLSQNYLTANLSQALSAEGRLSLGALALLLGGGGGTGLIPAQNTNFSTSNAYVSAGLEAVLGQFTLALRQLVGLGSTPGATDLSLDYALNANFGIRLQNRLYYTTLGPYDQGSLGVRGSFTNAELLRTLLGNSSATPDPGATDLGSTNIAATYELNNLSGQAGVARVGLDTSIPFSQEFSLLLAGSLTLADAGQGGAGGSIGFRYTGADLLASVRAELSGQAIQPGLKQVYDFGLVWRANDVLIISPAAQYVREATGDSGGKFSLAAAYRGDQLSILSNHVARTGFYQASDGTVYEGELLAGYEADQHWFLRAGAAARLSNPSTWTFQVGGGFTYFLTDLVGLGANTSYLFQPSSASGQLSLGLEGSLRVAQGLLFSAGVNLLGTQTSLAGFQTQPGLYLRLDWQFDETTFGVKY